MTREPVEVTLARIDERLRASADLQAAQAERVVALLEDHEDRIRVQEARKTVSPKVLAGTVFGLIGAFASLSPVLERIYT